MRKSQRDRLRHTAYAVLAGGLLRLAEAPPLLYYFAFSLAIGIMLTWAEVALLRQRKDNKWLDD